MSDTSYAVIQAGGRQVSVTPGKIITLNRVTGDAGSTITFNEVLTVKGSGDKDLRIGTPLLQGVSVVGTILAHDKAPKVIIFKKRRRKGFMKKTGHRQLQTRIRIDKISA